MGFCAIIKDENNVQTKNNMLSYVADLMEDCHDFGWQSAKGAHTVVLCHMEENKVNWDDTNKLDRLGRVHAQRTPNSSTSLGHKFKSKDKGIPCRFYQKGTCGKKKLSMKMGASCISMFVKTALQKVNLTPIQARIVDNNYQKTRRALQ